MNQYDTSASGRLPHAFTTPGSSSCDFANADRAPRPAGNVVTVPEPRRLAR